MYLAKFVPEPESVADMTDFERATLTVEANRLFKRAFFKPGNRAAQDEFIAWMREHVRLNEHTVRQSPADPKGIYIALEPEQRLPTISVNRRGEAMFLFDDGHERVEQMHKLASDPIVRLQFSVSR
jgi:hypothetical protein